MYQLRTYTLQTADALEHYATVRPATSAACALSVTSHGIWTQHGADGYRLVALISQPHGADPTELTTACLSSPDGATDMDGFDIDNIVNVSGILLVLVICAR